MYTLSNMIRVKTGYDLLAKGYTPDQMIDVMYDLTASHEQERLLLESATLDEIDEWYNVGDLHEMILEAITIKRYSQADGKLKALARVLEKHLPENIEVEKDETGGYAVQVGKPKKTGSLFATVTAQIPFSDGQALSIIFHSPDGDKTKIAASDEIIAFRFLLNKRDITHVVSPEKGKDVSLDEISKRVTRIVAKTSEKFQAKQKVIQEQKAELVQVEQSIESAAIQLDDEIKAAEKAKADLDAITPKVETAKTQVEKLEKVVGEKEKRLAELQAQKTASAGKTHGSSAAPETNHPNEPTPAAPLEVTPESAPQPEAIEDEFAKIAAISKRASELTPEESKALRKSSMGSSIGMKQPVTVSFLLPNTISDSIYLQISDKLTVKDKYRFLKEKANKPEYGIKEKYIPDSFGAKVDVNTALRKGLEFTAFDMGQRKGYVLAQFTIDTKGEVPQPEATPESAPPENSNKQTSVFTDKYRSELIKTIFETTSRNTYEKDGEKYVWVERYDRLGRREWSGYMAASQLTDKDISALWGRSIDEIAELDPYKEGSEIGKVKAVALEDGRIVLADRKGLAVKTSMIVPIKNKAENLRSMGYDVRVSDSKPFYIIFNKPEQLGLPAPQPEATPGPETTTNPEMTREEKQAIQKELYSLRQEAKTLGMGTEAEALYKAKDLEGLRSLVASAESPQPEPVPEIDPTTPEGYAQVMTDEALQLKYQDELDAYFNERIMAVRNELRKFGTWSSTPTGDKLVANEFEYSTKLKQVGGGKNVVGVTHVLSSVYDDFKPIEIVDMLQLPAKGIAQMIENQRQDAYDSRNNSEIDAKTAQPEAIKPAANGFDPALLKKGYYIKRKILGLGDRPSPWELVTTVLDNGFMVDDKKFIIPFSDAGITHVRTGMPELGRGELIYGPDIQPKSTPEAVEPAPIEPQPEAPAAWQSGKVVDIHPMKGNHLDYFRRHFISYDGTEFSYEQDGLDFIIREWDSSKGKYWQQAEIERFRSADGLSSWLSSNQARLHPDMKTWGESDNSEEPEVSAAEPEAVTLANDILSGEYDNLPPDEMADLVEPIYDLPEDQYGDLMDQVDAYTTELTKKAVANI